MMGEIAGQGASFTWMDGIHPTYMYGPVAATVGVPQPKVFVDVIDRRPLT